MVDEICLDTNIIIDSIARKEDALKLVRNLDFIDTFLCTTSVNVFELWQGERPLEKITYTINTLVVFDFDKDSAKIAGRIMKILKKEGKQLDMRDLFIASICIKNDLKLFTLNKKHFERLKRFGLKLL